jgi:hypothetical protein
MVLPAGNDCKLLRGISTDAGPAGHGILAEVGDQQRADDTSEQVRLAREDLASGHEWRARDRLAARVARVYDVEALELLGEVHAAMRDLPAAGAAWFGTRRRGPEVEQAVAAWRDQHGDSFAVMWSSLPRPVREHTGNARVDALRRRVEEQGLPTEPDGPDGAAGGGEDGGGEGVDAAVIIAVGLAVLFVLCAVVGFVTVVRWLVPGV